MTRVTEHMVNTGVMEHWDDKVIYHFDDKGHGALG